MINLPPTKDQALSEEAEYIQRYYGDKEWFTPFEVIDLINALPYQFRVQEAHYKNEYEMQAFIPVVVMGRQMKIVFAVNFLQLAIKYNTLQVAGVTLDLHEKCQLTLNKCLKEELQIGS